jgi:aminocarboxymuconate-semialdehyde decarboxylase
MKKDEPVKPSNVGRRDFMKIGAGGAGAVMTVGAALSALTGALRTDAAAQVQTKGEPFWAARPGKAGVGKPISIDCHAHWAPSTYNKTLAEMGQPVNNPFPLDFDLDKRLQWMDDHGDQMHCMTLSGGMPWQRHTAAEGARLAQVINDAGIEAHIKHPTRFVVGIELAPRDPQLALAELNRCAGKPGVRAVHMCDSIERHDYIFDPGWAPVLARIEQLGYPIIFHQMGGEPNNYGGNRTAGPPDLAAGLDAPIEHAVMATKFIITGTLDKYPKLDMVLPHAGGAFPYLAGRVEHFLYHMGNPGAVKLDRPYREYIRRFHYDYLIYYPEAFRFLVTMVGADRIVVGTDNFAAKDIEYPAAVLDQFNLSAQDRDLILEGNAKRLLHL